MRAFKARPPRLGHRLKRWLFLTHRWLGIASCILFAMWFVSGLVMIYVPFPALTQSERLAGLPAIDWSAVKTSPASFLRAVAPDALPRALSLEMRANHPVWRAKDPTGQDYAVSAINGDYLEEADAHEALGAATLFGRAHVSSLESIQRDQWTVAGSFNAHRPLWKATLAGPGGHVLYVSSQTGAVVLDTNARERFWNWIGSVPHWLYPTVLRQDNAAWRQVVMWVSGPCIVAGVTGFWVGILRTRLGRRRFKGGRIIPYHGWFEWHHIAGLIGGVFLIAWIFSGWLSVDPFRLFASDGITAGAITTYEKPGLPPPIDLARLARRGAGAKRVSIHWFAGRASLEIEAPGRHDILDAATLEPLRIDRVQIIAQARLLLPQASVASVEQLNAPDAYWYEIGDAPTIPVLRLRYDDPARSWVHIDPATGRVLGSLDTRRRVYRWLFDLLHKWDLNVLIGHRPSWDLLLWALSLLGLVTSVSGIWMGWKRLRRPHRTGALPAS